MELKVWLNTVSQVQDGRVYKEQFEVNKEQFGVNKEKSGVYKEQFGNVYKKLLSE